MLASHVSYEFAILAVLCSAVIIIFFCPVVQGPYSVVYGPVTTLVSLRARLLLWLGMALATIQLFCAHTPSQCLAAWSAARHKGLLPQTVPPERPIRRC